MITPVHAHLNLVGWVSVAICGLYYHVVPAATATLGGERLAIVGSLVTVVGMGLFAAVVVKGRV